MVVIQDFGRDEFHKDAVITSEQKEFWTKMQQKYPNHYEGEVAHDIFKELYPELALSLKTVSSSKNENPSWEQSLVHYADLRVLQEKIVTVSERLTYLRQRYPRGEEVWKQHQQKIEQEEQKIFSNLAFSPDELAEQMEKENKEIEQKFQMVQHG